MKLYFIKDIKNAKNQIVKILSYFGLVYAVLGWLNTDFRTNNFRYL